MDRQTLEEIVQKNLDEALKTLAELVRIKSTAGDPVTVRNDNVRNDNGQDQNSSDGKPDMEVYPFGQGVQDAFSYMLAKAEECGFQTCDVDHYGGHIEWKCRKAKAGNMDHIPAISRTAISGAAERWMTRDRLSRISMR